MKNEEQMEPLSSRTKACIAGFLIDLRQKTESKKIRWYVNGNKYETSLTQDGGTVYLKTTPTRLSSGHFHNFICSFSGGAFFDNYDYIADTEIEEQINALVQSIINYLEDRRKKEMSSSEKKLVDKLEKMMGWDD